MAAFVGTQWDFLGCSQYCVLIWCVLPECVHLTRNPYVGTPLVLDLLFSVNKEIFFETMKNSTY